MHLYYFNTTGPHGLVWADSISEAQVLVQQRITREHHITYPIDGIAIYPVYQDPHTEYQEFDW